MNSNKQAGDGDAALGLWMMTRSHVALVLAEAGSLWYSQIAFLIIEEVRQTGISWSVV